MNRLNKTKASFFKLCVLSLFQKVFFSYYLAVTTTVVDLRSIHFKLSRKWGFKLMHKGLERSPSNGP